LRPSPAGGSASQRLCCGGRVGSAPASSKPGEIQSAGPLNSGSLTLVWSGRVLHRHPDGVPVVALPPLVLPDERDHPVLPAGGVPRLERAGQAQRRGHLLGEAPPARRLVRHLVEHVGQVVDGVDDLAEVRLLERLDARVERELLILDDGGDADPVDIVGGVERMAPDVVRRRAEVEAPALEEHHRDVDARVAGGGDPVAEPREVGRVEPGEVELRLPVGGGARAGARPRLGRHAEVEGAPGGLGLELLPAPEPDEVVPVVLEEGQVGAVVVLLRLAGARGARAEAVVEVVPDVRAGQVDHPPLGLIGSDREVARIDLRDHEGAGGGGRSGQGAGRRRGAHGGSFVQVGNGHAGGERNDQRADEPALAAPPNGGQVGVGYQNSRFALAAGTPTGHPGLCYAGPYGVRSHHALTPRSPRAHERPDRARDLAGATSHTSRAPALDAISRG
jgi:hypothetical protein